LLAIVQVPAQYLFTDESGGNYSKAQLFHIPGVGRLSSGPGRHFFGPRRLSSGPGWLSSGTWTASARTWTVFLQSQTGHPSGPERTPPAPRQATSVARAIYPSTDTKMSLCLPENHQNPPPPVNRYPRTRRVQKRAFPIKMPFAETLTLHMKYQLLPYKLYPVFVWAFFLQKGAQ
jgi:hypothetical protein